MVALAVNPRNNELYGVQHGRDMLFENWPQFFTVEEDAVLPAEEFIRITRGSDNGWPYCYFDAVTENKKVLAPEYGGNGQLVSGGPGINCASLQPAARHLRRALGAERDGLLLRATSSRIAIAAVRSSRSTADSIARRFRTRAIRSCSSHSAERTAVGTAEIFADGFAGQPDRCRPTRGIVRSA